MLVEYNVKGKQVEVFFKSVFKKWKGQALNMRDSSVFDLNKLTSASEILNRINRVVYFFSPNFTQNRKSIYHGLNQVDVKSTLMSLSNEIELCDLDWNVNLHQGTCFVFYILCYITFRRVNLTFAILNSALTNYDKGEWIRIPSL